MSLYIPSGTQNAKELDVVPGRFGIERVRHATGLAALDGERCLRSMRVGRVHGKKRYMVGGCDAQYGIQRGTGGSSEARTNVAPRLLKPRRASALNDALRRRGQSLFVLRTATLRYRNKETLRTIATRRKCRC